jgi:hypothetical protein
MAAKAWGTAPDKEKKAVDEVFFSNDAVSLCLLIHRRAKTMRVIDFRAGPTNAKRTFVLSLAHREGVEKVYTLVERDEVATWVKLGFAKEGNIPGFYKRSDAFMLGCSVNAPPRPGARENALVNGHASEVRLALNAHRIVGSNGRAPELAAAGKRGRPLPPQLFASHVPVWAEDPVVAAPEEPEEPIDTRAHDFAEKTLVHAKKAAKELQERPLPIARLALLKESETKKPVTAALKAGRALTAFEPFGRDVERRYFGVTARGGFELVASTESQACFGNAFLELLTAPKNDAERLATASALRTLCDKLLADGVVSCFSLCPSDDVGLASAFAFNGFRRTGLLQNHLVVGGERKDGIIFSRKLANPADE